MTLEALTNLVDDFRAAVHRLEAARAAAAEDQNTRPVSIAITTLETARYWAIAALAEQDRYIAPNLVAENPDKQPHRHLQEARDILGPYVDKLRAEARSGSKKGLYRHFILKCHDELWICLQRTAQQLHYLDIP